MNCAQTERCGVALRIYLPPRRSCALKPLIDGRTQFRSEQGDCLLSVWRLRGSPYLARGPTLNHRRARTCHANFRGEDSATYLSADPLPPPIKQALANELGDGKTIGMVPRDADFQETDLIESPDGPLPFHRFIQAGHSGARWYLWIEIGGLGFHYGLIVNEWHMGEKQARLVTEQQVLPAENLCSETLKLLKHPPASGGG